jgi:glycosyltransferase involved in cell wall biosynthesis
MKFSVVTYHLPHPDGTATGRHVFAVWEAVRGAGHDVEAWCWGDPPAGLDPPSWVRCSRFHDPGGWRRLPATIRRPRGGIADVGWTPPPDAVAWAEEPESFPAIDGAARTGVSVYHSELLDAVALRRPRPAVVQSLRAERRAVRRAAISVGFSARVARKVGVSDLLPVTLPIPDRPVPVVSDPTVVMIADWAWPPNQAAMRRLMVAWPQVRVRIPAATLVLAGRGLVDPPAAPGVEAVGEVPRSRDVLERAAVFAFPCPSTSGPKMKVLDALAHGVPVLTTASGVEGLSGVEGVVAVADGAEFGPKLADLLGDPQRRGAMASGGRRAVLDHHAPERAAAARLELVARKLAS